MLDPQTYLTIWSAILFGMAVGYGLCCLMRIQGWAGAIMVVALLGMAYAAPRLGPVLLLEQPVQEPTQ